MATAPAPRRRPTIKQALDIQQASILSTQLVGRGEREVPLPRAQARPTWPSCGGQPTTARGQMLERSPSQVCNTHLTAHAAAATIGPRCRIGRQGPARVCQARAAFHRPPLPPTAIAAPAGRLDSPPVDSSDRDAARPAAAAGALSTRHRVRLPLSLPSSPRTASHAADRPIAPPPLAPLPPPERLPIRREAGSAMGPDLAARRARADGCRAAAFPPIESPPPRGRRIAARVDRRRSPIRHD